MGANYQQKWPWVPSGFPVNATSRPATLVEGARLIAANDYGVCAVMKKHGQVLCWGEDSFGQLGNGDLDKEAKWIPVGAAVPTNAITSLSGAGQRFCATTAEGNLYCWGAFGNGHTLGLGSPIVVGFDDYRGATCNTANGQISYCHTPTFVPRPLASLYRPYSEVSLGLAGGCALTQIQYSDGTVDQSPFCWGYQCYIGAGGFSTGQPDKVVHTPSGVLEFATSTSPPGGGYYPAVASTVGEGSSCWVSNVSGVQCAGHNYNGRLGAGALPPPPPNKDCGLLGGKYFCCNPVTTK